MIIKFLPFFLVISNLSMTADCDRISLLFEDILFIYLRVFEKVFGTIKVS